jgi:hypothetical protein
MTPDERKSLAWFALRSSVVLAVLLMPLPYLADGYVTVEGRATNAVLSVVDAGWRYGVRFDPPRSIAAQGSWHAKLRLEDRQTGAARALRYDARSLSYRSMAAFIALAAASRCQGVRRKSALWAGGLVAMFFVTTGFSALPILSRFAVSGAFGEVPGLVIRAAYQAIVTPVMAYALPLLVWWLLLRILRRPNAEHVATVQLPTTKGQATV